MRGILPLLSLLVLPAACGPADDAGTRRSGSTAGDAPPDAAAEEHTPGPRVVFLGTSLTAGLGLLRPEERFTARLDEMADSAGLDAVFDNAGVSGETSAGGLRRLDWVLRDSVHVLVVELGANDGLRGQAPAALEENLRSIVRRTRARYPEAEILLAGMEAPPNLGSRYTAAFRDVFRTVARDEDVELVPFLLEGVAGVPELNQDDRIHPNARGHARIAETVWPHLEPALRRAAERRSAGAAAGDDEVGAGGPGGAP